MFHDWSEAFQFWLVALAHYSDREKYKMENLSTY